MRTVLYIPGLTQTYSLHLPHLYTSVPLVNYISMGPLHIQRQSITGISPKVCWQILFKVSGYGDVGTVGPHTFIMSQVLKLSRMCNIINGILYFHARGTLYKITFLNYSSSHGILNYVRPLNNFASANYLYL